MAADEVDAWVAYLDADGKMRAIREKVAAKRMGR
jgi:hypothetical protein